MLPVFTDGGNFWFRVCENLLSFCLSKKKVGKEKRHFKINCSADLEASSAACCSRLDGGPLVFAGSGKKGAEYELICVFALGFF